MRNKISKFGTTFQQEMSLLDGAPREHPIQPLRRQPGIVQIGNRRVVVERRNEVAPPTDDKKRQFAQAFAKRQNHECAASLAGEFCGHPI